MRRIAALLAFLFPLGSALAQGLGNPASAIRADQWATAEAAVSDYTDPVPAKLVAYFRLLAPNAGHTDEIAAFIAANPDWPNQDLLERRRQEALASEVDATTLDKGCALHPLTVMQAELRCAEAARTEARPDEAAKLARDAWTGAAIVDPGAEAGVLQAWAAVLTADDQWARFDALADAANAASGNAQAPLLAAATRQALRVTPARRPLAEARLALIRGDANALTVGTSLPGDLSADPGLFLDLVRYLRRTNREPDALALWTARGDAVQKAVPARSAEFWGERNLLARHRMHDGDIQGAYTLISPTDLPDPDPDMVFFAGFLALRRLNDAKAATGYFQRLADTSNAAITQARAHYWLGRAAVAANADGSAEYMQAARYPLTFYGQLAARALGDDGKALAKRIAALQDPQWTHEQGLTLASQELTRAAIYLVSWGEPNRARAFLRRMDEVADGPAERSANAYLALQLAIPDMAVAISRRMGIDGIALPVSGWPAPYTPPSTPVDPAVALGLMRQESQFDFGALSPTGARGLMQLMPATAQATAQHLHETITVGALSTDPDLNMRIGTAYFKEVLDTFNGSLPLAIASYNAGPNRVQDWLAAYGDPRAAGGPDMLDWMESIPFSETRNYVQRVMENIAIYRARDNKLPPTLTDANGA